MAAEDAGELFLMEDEYDYDDEDEGEGEQEAANPSPIPETSPLSLASRKERRKHNKSSKSRCKRIAKATQRDAECDLKPRAISNAQAANHIDLPAFDHASLPRSSSGWTGNPRIKLSPGLQRVWKDLDKLVGHKGFKYIAWDGRYVFLFPAICSLNQ